MGFHRHLGWSGWAETSGFPLPPAPKRGAKDAGPYGIDALPATFGNAGQFVTTGIVGVVGVVGVVVGVVVDFLKRVLITALP